MARAQYVGVGGVARKVVNAFVGVGGVARKVKTGFVGVGGVARAVMGQGPVTVSGTDVLTDANGRVAYSQAVPTGWTKVYGSVMFSFCDIPFHGIYDHAEFEAWNVNVNTSNTGGWTTVNLPLGGWEEDENENDVWVDYVHTTDGEPYAYNAKFQFDDAGFIAYRSLSVDFDGDSYQAYDSGVAKVSYSLTFEY